MNSEDLASDSNLPLESFIMIREREKVSDYQEDPTIQYAKPKRSETAFYESSRSLDLAFAQGLIYGAFLTTGVFFAVSYFLERS